MVLAGLAYCFRSWRLLQVTGTAPGFLLFFYIWVLPESARWLLTQGRMDEAKQLIQKAASVNRRKLSPELLSQDRPLRERPGSVQTPPAPEGDPDSLLCLVSAQGSGPCPRTSHRTAASLVCVSRGAACGCLAGMVSPWLGQCPLL
ncbi:hypothetical protein P7K49_031378 [Saguinus oedipus]|uniref:Uncharacterized protein n=1 Tax=Saguinus oedipus TaxID=9490 RepID=A0ABQ9TZ88_SAGOE|nr:hypothetical protein P7K49_031378 [Saguinus oedipus]